MHLYRRARTSEETSIYLDVAVDDSSSVTLDNGFDDLTEKGFGHRFRQGTTVRDEVEEIFTRLHALHDEHEDVTCVACVQKLHHARHVRHLTQ